MKLSQLYPSEWLRASDLNGQDATLTIAGISVETMPGDDGKKQPVLWFRETDKKFGLNRTNGSHLGEMLGEETDTWVGKRVTLFPTRVDFQGKRVDAIRLRDRPDIAQAQKSDDLPF